MKFALPLLALAGTAFAHNFVTHFHINGVADPNCVRQAVSANPILDIYSSDMACNAVQGLAQKKCVVQGGDAIGFEWRVDRNIAPADYPLKDGSIPVGVTDDSHKGPCAVYMKKVSDSSTAEGEGDGWFKVSEDGLDSAGTFCTDRIRLANAPQPGIIPTNIEAGDYLIRAEMITLNNAGPANMGGLEQPQFYTGCVQITVEGTSGTNPDTVSIPGYVSMSSPGMIYDIWNSPSGTFSDYTVPGPAPLENLVPFKAGVPPATIGGSSGSTPSTKASSAPAASSTAAPYTSEAAATPTYAPVKTTKASAPAVTSTPASYDDDNTQDTPAETSPAAEDVPAETSAAEDFPPAETSAVEDAPAETTTQAGGAPTQAPVVGATTVTCTTLVTQYTTVSVTAGETTSTVVVDGAGPSSEATAEPTRAHGRGRGYRGGRAHRRRQHV